MGMSRWVHLNVLRVEKETDKAFLLSIEEHDVAEWIPKSQISDPDDYEEGDEDVTISVTEYIAQEKGLEVRS